jgi:hypothetical protein
MQRNWLYRKAISELLHELQEVRNQEIIGTTHFWHQLSKRRRLTLFRPDLLID